MKNKNAELTLQVMGRRSLCKAYSLYTSSSRLIAQDPSTLTPVMATWTYAGDTEGVTSNNFWDISPQRLLTVSAAGYVAVTLHAQNVYMGTYSDSVVGDLGAFMVVDNDRTINGWGGAYNYILPPVEENHDVNIVCTANRATVALRIDSSLFAWGDASAGGELKISDQQRTDVVDIALLNRGILRGTNAPHISEWGSDSAGTNRVPDYITSMDNIIDAQISYWANIVLNSAGQVFAWGTTGPNIVPPDIQTLTDIKSIYLSEDACTALRQTGQVVAWGDTRGGVIPAEIAVLTDIEHVVPGTSSFCALRANGSVVSWGQTASLPPEIAALTSIVHIIYTNNLNNVSGYLVLCQDGSVYGWGDNDGGLFLIPVEVSDVVSLTACSWGSCAALKRDGSIAVWGDGMAVDTSAVSSLLINVQAVYSGADTFVALKADNSMIVWGDLAAGGNMIDIPASLQGRVTYLV